MYEMGCVWGERGSEGEGWWGTRGFRLDCSEFLAEEDALEGSMGQKSLFWKFVEQVNAHTAPKQADFSAKQATTLALDLAASLVDPLAFRVLAASVGSRANAPAVVGLSGEAPDGVDAVRGWAVVGGDGIVVDDAGKLGGVVERLLEEEGGEGLRGNVFDLDHEYVNEEAREGDERVVDVVVYVALGTEGAQTWHEAAKGCLRRHQCRYFLRHAILPSNNPPTTRLSGYGVSVDLKSTEYKVVDDGQEREGVEIGESVGGRIGEAVMEWLGVGGGEGEGVVERVFDAVRNVAIKAAPGDADVEGSAEWLAALPSVAARNDSEIGIRTTSFLINAIREAHVPGGRSSHPKGAGPVPEHPKANKSHVAYDPLQLLTTLTGNFPDFGPYLSSTPISLPVQMATLTNRQIIGAGTSHVLVNGRSVDVMSTSFNFFSLLKTIRAEAAILDNVKQLPLGSSDSRALLQLSPSLTSNTSSPSSSSSSSDALPDFGTRVEVRPGARGVVQWFNNVEKDPSTKQWPATLRAMASSPMGGYVPVRKNVYTLLFLLDPSKPSSLRALLQGAMMTQQNLPVRLGIVLASEEEEEGGGEEEEGDGVGEDGVGLKGIAGLLASLPSQDRGNFLQQCLVRWQRRVSANAGGWVGLSLSDVVDGFVAVRKTRNRDSWKSELKEEALQAIEDVDGKGEALLAASREYVESKGLPVPGYVLNGRVGSGVDMQSSSLGMDFGEEVRVVQELVATKALKDHHNVFGRIMDLSGAVDSWDARIMNPDVERGIQLATGVAQPLREITYKTHPQHKDEIAAVSMILADNFSTAKGLRSAANLLEAVSRADPPNDPIRVAIVDTTSPTASLDVLRFFAGSEGNNATIDALRAAADAIDTGKEASIPSSSNQVALKVYQEAATSLLGLIRAELAAEEQQGASRFLLANGRFILLREQEVLQPSTVLALAKVEARTRGVQVRDFVSSVALNHPLKSTSTATVTDDASNSISEPTIPTSSFELDSVDDADLHWVSWVVSASCSVLGRYHALGRRVILPESELEGSFSAFDSAPRVGESSGIDVVALLDPVSAEAQRAAPLLVLLRDVLGARVRVFLSPARHVNPERPPLQSYYRLVAPNPIAPKSSQSTATLSLPAKRLLTVKIHAPEPMNVQLASAPADLDNVLLEDGGSVHAIFALRSMLVAGQCDDLTHGRPPNGLQLRLESLLGPRRDAGRTLAQDDGTLVMQNLGYFQLQADPGLHALSITPGRGSELYNILDDAQQIEPFFRTSSSETISTPSERVARWKNRVTASRGLQYLGGRHSDASSESLESVTALPVVVRDFTGAVTQVRVEKKIGKEKEKLLQLPSKGGGLWESFFGGNDGVEDDGRVHVFSLASGAVYERMLKIMMLSVSRRCSRPVTFWLVENFLSPEFKKRAVTLANHHGFEVNYVTYRWPNWLRAQTEKQRQVWGYKVLFLDVLFPLRLKRVIFVDADQVVRSDLAELWDLDLKGAAYAMTPFCDGSRRREETKGYRFWDSGYWKDHLDGKRPYHISALFVVDLEVFRREAVGDRLRAIYDQLSRDPNSLSNADQDLLQFDTSLKIYSLPQEWLWCESWCNDGSKEQAKTIDLCNNPLHKEPKLDMARRIISGPLFEESWEELDAIVSKTEVEE